MKGVDVARRADKDDCARACNHRCWLKEPRVSVGCLFSVKHVSPQKSTSRGEAYNLSVGLPRRPTRQKVDSAAAVNDCRAADILVRHAGNVVGPAEQQRVCAFGNAPAVAVLVAAPSRPERARGKADGLDRRERCGKRGWLACWLSSRSTRGLPCRLTTGPRRRLPRRLPRRSRVRL